MELHASQPVAPLYDGTQDPQFQRPYVDIDEWRDLPVRHRYIHGGFEGTGTRFSFYYPPEEGYERRFFHFVSPVQGSENANQGNDGAIGFSVSSGAYFVESNMGGMSSDITLVYRASAAVAQYSRVKAAELYGPHRPYGYIYGGSGGGYKTISCIESKTGVWDGAVPFVIGTPMAMPYNFTVRVHAMRILKDKFPSIIDALEPGGSGDMYAGLNEEERQALEEVTRMGFPPKTWFAYNEIGEGALSVLSPAVFQSDPSYFEDFWTVPGYLGADPSSSASRVRLHYKTVITEVIRHEKQGDSDSDRSMMMGVDEAWKSLQGASGSMSAPTFRLESAPSGDLYIDGAYIVFTSGEAAGQKVPIGQINGDVVTIGSAFGFHESVQYLDKIKPGDEIMLDNSDYIALQTYHRHQVPTPDFYVWDQYLDKDGQPLYPQRPFLLGPAIAFGGAGSVQSGRFEGKMIVVETLMDESAFPWQADWYRTKVKEALGEKLDDRFRLWYIDHAIHADSYDTLDDLHIVSYLGALHQALRDLSAWVERGVAPPASTDYEIASGQVSVPPEAAQRKGIQPVVTLKANGGLRADVSVGEVVSFSANIELPPNTGKIVSAEWDFEGEGTYPIEGTFSRVNEDGSQVVIEASYAFSKPGTYFPVLRAASSREGNDKYTQVLNLCRVRVVVT
ncbi:Tat pathway signal sequence domain protein [Paenibacillus sp. LHD-38]|uniref:Tat pathway signal sequence domain protein n=1 Tax=Paenibacillus sp. LHD-38 TaxID=3072143 RepID=UPI00280F3F6A|nr:Tat pathway signal sequence domain protein [Paenibacillus sp. LHD-38]MDQ8734268.1 Tat pathway signal sequence domain protein [Paenibacillus sp. LHD-38]